MGYAPLNLEKVLRFLSKKDFCVLHNVTTNNFPAADNFPADDIKSSVAHCFPEGIEVDFHENDETERSQNNECSVNVENPDFREYLLNNKLNLCSDSPLKRYSHIMFSRL